MVKVKFLKNLLILLLIPCLLRNIKIAKAQEQYPNSATSPTDESSFPPSDTEFQALSNQIKNLEKDHKELNTKFNSLESRLSISQQENLKFKDNIKNLEKQINILNNNEKELKQVLQNNSDNLTELKTSFTSISISTSIFNLLVSLIAIFASLYIAISLKIQRKNFEKKYIVEQKISSRLQEEYVVKILEDISKINNFCESNTPNLQSLDKLLSHEETSKILENAIKITGSLKTIDRSWVNFSEEELIDIYNTAPNLLLKQAIRVSISQENISSTVKDNILLMESYNGNYYIIGREDQTYWLLPKNKIKINPYNINTVQSLFECQNYQQGREQEFILQKPGRVSILANGQEWILEEKGVLDFNNNF